MPTTTKTVSRRYYYTKNKSFEQSLDVYKPVFSEVEQDNSTPSTNLPLVVLVVGSAWLGHRSIIYTGTSWWNSSGPKAFAQQGCVTVCIRHRGSFPRLAGSVSHRLGMLALVAVLVVATMVTMYAFPNVVAEWKDSNSGPVVVSTIIAVLLGWVLLALGQRGAADFETMLHDTSDALCWVQRHRDSDILRNFPSSGQSNSCMEEKKESDSNHKEGGQQTLVFGGYSSGGHVAATLMQRPHLFAQKGLPAPDKFCDGALFISGVLAVRPPATTTTTSTTTWCTDLVTTLAFGKSGAANLPSPLDGIHKQPKVPHLLIGCEKEVFGIEWMDVFFCSRAFCDSLTKRKVPAKFVEVQSDHWNILSSKSLSNVLSDELEWIRTKALE